MKGDENLAVRKKEINYILQIKCFYEWLQRHQLSSSAINLWHGLMYLWNQSFWESNFTPAISSITARTGLSKSTILRARNELASAGLLSITETKKGCAVRYKLVQFCENSDTIYKLNKTKQNKTIIPPNIPPGGKERRKNAKEKKRSLTPEEQEEIRAARFNDALQKNIEAGRKFGTGL